MDRKRVWLCVNQTKSAKNHDRDDGNPADHMQPAEKPDTGRLGRPQITLLRITLHDRFFHNEPLYGRLFPLNRRWLFTVESFERGQFSRGDSAS